MGSSCSIRGHDRVAPAYPASRRVLFCGMGRSGKTTLIKWIINSTATATVTLPSTTTSIPLTTNNVPNSNRTTATSIHLYNNESLALIDTPDMLALDGHTIQLDSKAQERIAAIVFVVDVTDHIRGILAEELLINTLKRLQLRTRPGTLVLIVGNQRHQDENILVNIASYPTLLPLEIIQHYTIRTMSFSTEKDVNDLAKNLEPI